MTLSKLLKRDNDSTAKEHKARRAQSAARAAGFRNWQNNLGLPNPMSGGAQPQRWN